MLKHLLFTFSVLFVFATSVAQDFNLKAELKSIPSIKKVKKLKPVDHFSENYEFWYEQSTDPGNENSPKFLQRCLIGHAGADRPLIIELEGYNIFNGRAGELSEKFKVNQLTIEHRYFANSKPKDGIPWNTLTVSNAAHDQHLIIQSFHKIYPNSKFISTGISKGGQTAMIHRSFFPDDVDGSVCYVAPLCFTREDPRIYTFLDTVGSAIQRNKIHDFQAMCFSKKKELVEILSSVAEENNWSWFFDVDKAFDYYVLEYSFAFWQWGSSSFSKIPNTDSDNFEILNHLLQISGVSFFEKSGVEDNHPYFYAALTQMGIYGYQTSEFPEYFQDTSIYKFDFAFPEGTAKEFDNNMMISVHDFINNDAENMIFIYGAYDTWSATAVQLEESCASCDVYKYMLAKGHHDTRIKSFKKADEDKIFSIIESWIK